MGNYNCNKIVRIERIIHEHLGTLIDMTLGKLRFGN